MRERKNVRVNAAVRLLVSQGQHSERGLTLNLGAGGLSFCSEHRWSAAEPLCFILAPEREALQVFGRVVRREGVVLGVQFYPERSVERRIHQLLRVLVERVGMSAAVLDACAACGPGESPAIFVAPQRRDRRSRALTPATLGDVGLDGATLRSDARPPVGDHVVVSLQRALGRPLTVTGEVVRHTPAGFAVLYADASHASKRVLDTVRTRLAPRDDHGHDSSHLSEE